MLLTTHNRRIELRPERDGSTTVVRTTLADFPVGTRVIFGPALPRAYDSILEARSL